MPPFHPPDQTILPIVPNPYTDDECDPYLHPTLLYAFHLPTHAPLWRQKHQKEIVKRFSGHHCVFRTVGKGLCLDMLCGPKSTALRQWLHKHIFPTASRSTTTTRKHQHQPSTQPRKRFSRRSARALLLYVRCQQALKPVSLQSADAFRSIKTPRDIARMQRACDISCDAIQHMVEHASSFTNTQQMLDDGMDILRHHTKTTEDRDTTAYTTILTLNGHGKHITRTGLQRVHPTFESYTLDHPTKPLLLLDMGARYGGFCADITRTFSTTTPTDRQIDVYRSVLTLYELGESMVKPGVWYKDINQAVKTKLESELQRLGFKDFINVDKYMPHSLGHSVGIEVHDTPSIFDVGPLQPNMVLTIEPGIYTDEMDIRIENTIVVTEEGCRVLSNKVPWSMEWFMDPAKKAGAYNK